MPTTKAASGGTADAGALRSDAARNRRQLIDAACKVFAERGIDAPLDDVARHAGVGIATLYRRFPTRNDLLAAAFEDRMAAHADAIDAALGDADAWHGFCTLVESICVLQAGDRAMKDVLTMTFPAAPGFEEARGRAYQATVELVRRAQVEGSLRPDFVPEDLLLLLMANAGVVSAMGDAAPDAWQRVVAYLLDAFHARSSSGPLPKPPSPRQMAVALARLQRRPSDG